MPQKKNSAGNDPGAGDVLGSTEIMRGIGTSTLEAIAAAAMQKMVEEGETLYSVGDPVRSVYVVAAGRLRFILGGDGRPAAQGTIIRAGDILVATEPPHFLSARNILPGAIESLETRGAMVALRVKAGATLIVHVTPGAVRALDLTPGLLVWLVIKTHSCHLVR